MMKKLLLTLLIACCVGSSAMAQLEYRSGIKAGLNVASLSNGGGDARITFAYGTMVETQLNDKWGATVELLYSMQGNSSSALNVTHTNRLDYLVLPIMANYYLCEGLSINAGVQPGLNVNAMSVLEEGDNINKTDIGDGVQDFDFAIPVGFSYRFAEDMIVDLRYTIGLSDVNANYSGDMRNNVFQLSLGYFF